MQKQAREIVQKDILQLQNCCLEIAEKKKKKRWEVSSVLLHCIFSVQGSVDLPSFFFSLPCLFLKSVVVSMGRARDTPAMKGSSGLWAPLDICGCFAGEKKNKPTTATPISVQCA